MASGHSNPHTRKTKRPAGWIPRKGKNCGKKKSKGKGGRGRRGRNNNNG